MHAYGPVHLRMPAQLKQQMYTVQALVTFHGTPLTATVFYLYANVHCCW